MSPSSTNRKIFVRKRLGVRSSPPRRCSITRRTYRLDGSHELLFATRRPGRAAPPRLWPAPHRTRLAVCSAFTSARSAPRPSSRASRNSRWNRAPTPAATKSVPARPSGSTRKFFGCSSAAGLEPVELEFGTSEPRNARTIAFVIDRRRYLACCRPRSASPRDRARSGDFGLPLRLRVVTPDRHARWRSTGRWPSSRGRSPGY